ncbi:MAG: class I SAM-dependent methyltransferase [Chloroflexota bacterium]
MTARLPDSRRDYVTQMFSGIAERYDLMNRLMTLGMDTRWRRQAADLAQLRPGQRALDVAAGTGDLAIELAGRVGPGGQVIGIDLTEPMLQRGRRKLAGKNLPVRLELGDGLEIAYPDNHFDAVTCAFGLRNMDDRQLALNEMSRVAKPGSRVVILELTPPHNEVARLYMDSVIPRLGQLIASAGEAYTYLPESAKEFPQPAALGHMFQAAGLRDVAYRLINFGTVALHWGTK